MTQYFEIRDDKIFQLSREKFLDMTISEIMDGSYIVKRDWDGKTVRYVSDDLAHAKSIARGEVRWLHEVFESLANGAGMDGPAALKSRLSAILCRNTVELVKEIFPGAVEVGGVAMSAQKEKSAQASIF